MHELPGLCDSSHPLVTVFDVFCAQLQSLLVLMTERDSEVILEDNILQKRFSNLKKKEMLDKILKIASFEEKNVEISKEWTYVPECIPEDSPWETSEYRV